MQPQIKSENRIHLWKSLYGNQRTVSVYQGQNGGKLPVKLSEKSSVDWRR